jgi:hypothetical protein
MSTSIGLLATGKRKYHNFAVSYDLSAHVEDLLSAPLISALCGKYETMRELRLRPQLESSPRLELASLAAAFPGALRELDRLPFAEIERRIELLRAVLSGRSEPAHWMLLQIAYHGFMRATLRLRRALLAREATTGAPAALAPSDYRPGPGEPPAERFDAVALAAIRRPAEGRLNPWVLAEVARDHGVTVACVEDALWSAKRTA